MLLGRVRAGELKAGATILLESMWREHKDPAIVASYEATVKSLQEAGYRLYEIPLERECRALMTDARRGKNMFVLGMLCSIYSLDLQLAREQIARIFGKKDHKVIATNVRAARGRLRVGRGEPRLQVRDPGAAVHRAAGRRQRQHRASRSACWRPAWTSARCIRSRRRPRRRTTCPTSSRRSAGIVHQAEDEIAACAFAIGASYAGRCAVTITSGPGYSLKQEGLGLAVMAEIPLVVVNVQRGGPSTGQPTKVEQGDLLTAIYGSHGDAPKVVMAVDGIEDCFYSMITARKIAETFNMVVVVLSDASLATAQQPFPAARVRPRTGWRRRSTRRRCPKAPSPTTGTRCTGLARRFVPGQPGGMHTLTGLAHDR